MPWVLDTSIPSGIMGAVQKIGHRVRAWRLVKNWSQEMAKLVGVSQAFWSRFEAGTKLLGPLPAKKLQELTAQEIQARDCVSKRYRALFPIEKETAQ